MLKINLNYDKLSQSHFAKKFFAYEVKLDKTALLNLIEDNWLKQSKKTGKMWLSMFSQNALWQSD